MHQNLQKSPKPTGMHQNLQKSPKPTGMHQNLQNSPKPTRIHQKLQKSPKPTRMHLNAPECTKNTPRTHQIKHDQTKQRGFPPPRSPVCRVSCSGCTHGGAPVAGAVRLTRVVGRVSTLLRPSVPPKKPQVRGAERESPRPAGTSSGAPWCVAWPPLVV